MTDIVDYQGYRNEVDDQTLLAEQEAFMANERAQQQQQTAQGDGNTWAFGDATVGGFLKDVGQGIAEFPYHGVYGGMRDAAQETLDTAENVLAWVGEKTLPEGTVDAEEGLWDFELGEVPEPESGTGQLVRNATQFITGYIPAMKAIKALGVTSKLGQAFGGGAIADAVAFDAHQERVSDLIQSWEGYPNIQNAAIDYLASDPNDSELEGKLKNALEGAGLGAVAEGVFAGLRIARPHVGRFLDWLAEDKTGAGAALDNLWARTTEEAAAAADEAATRTFGDINDDVIKLMDEAGPEDMRPASSLGVKGGDDREWAINLARINSTDDVKQLISDIETTYAGQIDEVRRKTITRDMTRKMADDLDMTVDDLLNRQTGTAFNAEQALAARTILTSSAENLQKLGAKAALPGASALDQAVFAKAFKVHAGIQAQVTGMTAEAGRALGSFNIAAGASGDRVDAIRQLMTGTWRPANTQKLAALVAASDEAIDVNRLAKHVGKPRFMDMVSEVFLNSILSGPKTHAVNGLSNSLVGAYMVPERMLAGGVEAVDEFLGGAPRSIYNGESGAVAFGMIEGMADGLKLASNAALKRLKAVPFADKVSTLQNTRGFDVDPGVSQAAGTGTSKWDLPHDPAFTMENVANLRAVRSIPKASDALMSDSNWVKGLDFLAASTRMPGTALEIADVFFKSVNYRGELRAQAYRAARQQGLSGKDAAEFMVDFMADPPEHIYKQAYEAAHVNTFTNELGERGQWVQRALADTPIIRYIVPFVRTPVNITKFVGMRSPLAPLANSFREDFMAGGPRRAQAVARMALGSGVMAWAFSEVSSDRITGAAPDNQSVRELWGRNKRTPYSIKIGDKWIPYNRLDPIGMTIGLGADLAQYAGDVEVDEDWQGAAFSVALSISNNLMGKTYLSTLSDVMAIPTLPTGMAMQRAKQFLTSTLAAHVPFSSLTRQIHQSYLNDPIYRDVQGLVDKVKADSWGYSETLPARLNLWGFPRIRPPAIGAEVLSPLHVSDPAHAQPIDKELWRLHEATRGDPDVKVTIPSMPGRVRGGRAGLRLEPDEYNEFVYKAGAPAMEYLNGMIQDPGYKSAPDWAKVDQIHKVVKAYRDAAWGQMLQENPELRQRYEQKLMARQ